MLPKQPETSQSRSASGGSTVSPLQPDLSQDTIHCTYRKLKKEDPCTPLKDQACIVGVGETGLIPGGSGKTDLVLMLEASMNAITDAGLSPHDIDGIIPPPLPSTAEHFAANLGVEDLRYAVTVHMGGASPVTSLQSAAMAVACGVAKNILVPLGWNGYSTMRVRDMGNKSKGNSGGGSGAPGALANTIGEYYLPYGANVPVQWYAWLATRHKELYGTPGRGHGPPWRSPHASMPN